MAKQTELRLSYSVGAKINTGNFENQDMHVSQSETWEVGDLSDEEVKTLADERYAELRVVLEERLSKEVDELVGTLHGRN